MCWYQLLNSSEVLRVRLIFIPISRILDKKTAKMATDHIEPSDLDNENLEELDQIEDLKIQVKRLLFQEIALSQILILGWRIDDQTSPAELLDSVVLQK